MQAIKFELSGKSAMFKKPDVNSYAYFTYNNIHKIALMGMLGAILGLGGYNRQNREISRIGEGRKKAEESDVPEGLRYPEFYQRLQGLKVSILPPRENKGYFPKKIQVFNNSVGYACREKGGNLIVREQWLENPRWDIYILNDGSIDKEIFEKLKDCLLNGKVEFVPYLGKNDHVAHISKCSVVELEKAQGDHIDSLFMNENADIGDEVYDEDQLLFVFKEVVPYALNSKYNFYEFKESIMTNLEIKNVGNLENTYTHEGLILAFY